MFNLTYPPSGTAILNRANILVLMSDRNISAIIVGATQEYEASPTPTRLRNKMNNQKRFLHRIKIKKYS